MRCERCRGFGFVAIPSRPCRTLCPDCQGLGITYCCDEAGANPPNSKDYIVTGILDIENGISELYRPIDIHGEESPNDHGC